MLLSNNNRHLFLSTILVFITTIGLLVPNQIYAQLFDRTPALPAFESAYMIHGQSVTMQSANTLEFAIQHRFGRINSNSFDMFGLYGHANDIRMGLNYYPTDRIHIGVGSTKSQMLQDLNWKWLLLRQSRDDVIPVSVAYAGNTAVSVREDPNFYPEFSHRLSYYHELMVARRFNYQFSLQLSASYAHFNRLYEGLEHDNFSVAARSRFSLSPLISIILEYDQPLTSHEAFTPKPGLGTGVEFATRSHEFQVFISNFDALMPQRNIHQNRNEIGEFDFMIGFNITRRWNL